MEVSTRAVYRGQITKLVNATDLALQKCTVSGESGLDLLLCFEEELNVLLDRLKAAYESLNKANSKMKPVTKAEDVDKETETIAEYNDKAVTSISLLSQRLKSIRYYQERINPVNVSMAAPLSPPASKPNALHLQKLKLKTFSGNFKDWIPFWEQFRSLVHENAALSPIDKYNYLEVALTGRAAETIAGFTPSEANYVSAIALLKEEYGNTDKIIDHTMQQLLAIQPIASKSNVACLRQLYNTVRSATRSLAHLGVPTSTYFVMLKGVLLRCLPKEFRVDFHKYSEDNRASEEITAEENDGDSISVKTFSSLSGQITDKQVNFLLKFLKREIESLEKAGEAGTHTSNEVAARRKVPNTAIGLHIGAADNCCFYCKSSSHGTKDCDVEKTLMEKKTLLQKDGRCFRCCKRGHSAKFCKVRVICRKCGGRHASCVCDPSFKPPKPVQHLPSSSSSRLCVDKESFSGLNDQSREHTASTMKPLNTVNLHSALCKSNDILLQTACVYVTGENSIKSQSLFTRIIIDGGSQLSFIKRSVSSALDLPVVKTQRLSVIPFGTERQGPAKQYNCVRVTIHSQWSDNAVTIDAIEVPEICVDTLPSPDNLNMNEIINDLNLADFNLNKASIPGICVLIGADTYWSVVTGEFKRIGNGLTAVKTIFGWTLQGPVPEDKSTKKVGGLSVLNVHACMDVERFWQLESIGILPENTNENNQDIRELIQLKNDRFVAQIPWKIPQLRQLKNNYNVASVRLANLKRKNTAAGHTSDQMEQQLSLPKLELTAALLAARLLTYIKEKVNLKFDREFLWSDSRITLHWIMGNQKRWTPYVENRVREIRSKTNISSWYHCSGSRNPADHLTRGLSPKELVELRDWRGGPDWLLSGDFGHITSTCTESEEVSCLSILMSESVKVQTENTMETILRAENFISWKRLLRVTAYVLIAVDRFKKRQVSARNLRRQKGIYRCNQAS